MIPKFANMDGLSQQALTERIFNDILMDIKMANHVIKKADPERADWVLASILHEANMKQVKNLSYGLKASKKVSFNS